MYISTLTQELQAENTRLQGELLQSRLELQSSLAEALKLLTDGAEGRVGGGGTW